MRRLAWGSGLIEGTALRYSAYAAKAFLNENPRKLGEMKDAGENCDGEYERWLLLHKNKLFVDFYTINSVYNELFKVEEVEEEEVDYNLAVTEVLEIAKRDIPHRRHSIDSDESYRK